MRLLRLAKVFGFITLVGVGPLLRTGSCQESLSLPAQFSIPVKGVPLRAIAKASLEITNDSDQPLTVHLGADDEEAFTMTVTGPDGEVRTITKPATEGLHTTGELVIQPKGTRTLMLTLNRWFRFESTGVYKIRLSVDAPIREIEDVVSNDGNIRRMEGKSLGNWKATFIGELNVTARDIAFLERQCQGLLETIRSAPDYGIVIDAAKDLSAVNDPAAAPYLVQAAESRKAVSYILISGLEQLGSPDAVEGLIKLTKSHDTDTRVLAVGSLVVLEESAQGAAVKERIKSSLAEIPQDPRVFQDP